MSRTHIKSLVETDYLGQHNFMRPDGSFREVTVVIERVERWKPEVKRRKKQADGSYRDEPSKRVKITFRPPAKKPWLSGPATQAVIVGMYGSIIEDWIGKPVTLYVDPDVMMGKSRVGGVRVRPVRPLGAPTTAPIGDEPLPSEVAKKLDDAATQTLGAREPGDD